MISRNLAFTLTFGQALFRPSEAELPLRELLAKSDQPSSARYSLGIALRALGREEVMRALKQAVELGYVPARYLLR